tara:strand:+ start:993 stop:2717 length:1725 start_codon:yes stop_codon:yes gene_type:complete
MNKREDEKYINESEYNINPKNIFSFLLRNSILIFGLSFVSLLIGLFKYQSLDKIWQGEFTIVVSENSSPEPGFENGRNFTSNFIPRLSKSGGIKNDIVILKSPSVLMPIFEYVKAYKAEKGIDTSNYEFLDWKKSVDVEITPETTVLIVSYMDTDKKIIPEVLKKMSNAYQEYSVRQENRRIEKTEKYLNNQINIFEKKALNSQEEYLSYGFKNNISLSLNSTRSIGINNLITNAELLTATVSAELKLAKTYLDSLNNSSDDFETFKAFAINAQDVFSLKIDGSMKEYEELNDKSIYYKTLYQPNDITLKIIEDKRLAKERLIKEQIKNMLRSYIESREKILESNYKPEKYISEYKRLVKVYIGNQDTLNQLNSQKRSLSLQKEKTPYPWEIITLPYTYDYPVAPRKLTVIPPYLIVGLLIAFLLSKIIEIKSDLLFYEDILLKKVSLTKLSTFDYENSENWEESLNLLVNGILKEKKYEKISFIFLGNLEEKLINLLKEKLDRYKDDFKIKFENKLIPNDPSDINILITQVGAVTNKEIENFKEKSLLINSNFLGLILFSNKKITTKINWFEN